MACPAGAVEELAQLLRAAHAPGPQMAEAAERLRSGEARQGFGPALLQLVGSAAAGPEIRQAAALYFKNFVLRCWLAEASAMAHVDREPIRRALVPLMASAPKPVRAALGAALEELVAVDFPTDWPTLVDELVQTLRASTTLPAATAAMEVAHSVFLRYRSISGCGELVREARSCAEQFGPAHLEVWAQASDHVLSGAAAPDALRENLELLAATARVFFDLNVPALPAFFSENREAYLSRSLALLGSGAPTASTCCSRPDVCPLEALRVQICSNLALYSSRYDEDLQPHVEACVKAAWGLAVANPGTDLATAAMGLLSSMAATEWQPSPFEDPATLRALCEAVVLPNVQLGREDLELFSEEPEEFLRRDLEGADRDSPRRASVDLVRALRRHYDAKVCELIVAYVSRLLEQAKVAALDQEVLCKDACANLVMSLAGLMSSKCTPHAVILDGFLKSVVVPELGSEPTASRAVLRAACLKYVTVLRSHLCPATVASVVPGILRHMTSESAVVHTYAAHCLGSLLTVVEPTSLRSSPTGSPSGSPAKRPPPPPHPGSGWSRDTTRRRRYDPQAMLPAAAQAVPLMLQLLAERRGIEHNEYVARSLVQVLDYLQLFGGPDAGCPPQTLGALAQLVSRCASGPPANPEYAHDLFECAALLARAAAPTRSEEAAAALVPVMGRIWQEANEDLLPYCVQVFALLLDATPLERLDTSFYAALLPGALEARLWRLRGCVPALVRLLRSFFARREAFGSAVAAHLPTIFERFSLIVGHQKLAAFAFELLNSVFRYLEFEAYRPFLPAALSLVLSCGSRGLPHIEKECSVSLLLLAQVHGSPGMLPQVLEVVQPGGFHAFVMGTLLPGTSRVLLPQRRKICIFGILKLMGCREVLESKELLAACCEGLARLLRAKNAGLVCWLSAVLPLKQEEPQGGEEFEVPFSRLRFADGPGSPSGTGTWDPLPELRDSAAVLAAARAALEPLRPALAGLGEAAAPLAEALGGG